MWAYDCELREMVLVIPSVLAIVGDNLMQSEIACHIGLTGKFFCRVCWVCKGHPLSGDSNEDGAEGDADSDDDGDGDGHLTDAASDASVRSQTSHRGQTSQRGRRKAARKAKPETMEEMIDQIRRFLHVCLYTDQLCAHILHTD